MMKHSIVLLACLLPAALFGDLWLPGEEPPADLLPIRARNSFASH